MKDSKDKKTIDFVTPARGRPVTGTAKTAAERKRDQRVKMLEEFEAGSVAPYANRSTAYLHEYLKYLIDHKKGFGAKVVFSHLLNRAGE